MSKERIYPNYRKVYNYEAGDKYISFRLIGENCSKAFQFIHFENAVEAENYFHEVI